MIFFSDPAVREAANDLMDHLHTIYVDEYREHPTQDVGGRRQSVRVISMETRRSTQTSVDSIVVDKIVTYAHPKLAKYINWILTKIFKLERRPRKCRNVSTISYAVDSSVIKMKTGSTFYLPSDPESEGNTMFIIMLSISLPNLFSSATKSSCRR
jgi:hypothetical protein